MVASCAGLDSQPPSTRLLLGHTHLAEVAGWSFIEYLAQQHPNQFGPVVLQTQVGRDQMPESDVPDRAQNMGCSSVG